jgi:hypothetical protein
LIEAGDPTYPRWGYKLIILILFFDSFVSYPILTMKNFFGSSFLILLFAGALFGAFYQFDPDFRFRIDRQFVPADTVISETPVIPSKSPVTPISKPSKGKWAQIDAHALATPNATARDIPTLVSHLCKPAKNDWEKARVIFRWITDNIRYDDDAYNTEKYGSLEPEDILRARKGVCEHFCILFKAMAEAAGLKAEKISGYAKGYSYVPGSRFKDTDHAWNAVFIDGGWHLLDATWAQGYAKTQDGKMVSTKQFDGAWFDTPPAAFVFKHLPKNSQWQFLSKPVTMQEYEQMPEVGIGFFSLGYDAEKVLDQVRRHPHFELPEIYDHPYSIKGIQLPVFKHLPAGKAISFQFECDDCYSMAVINNSEWTILEKKGKVFSTTLTPVEGRLSINAKGGKKGNRHDGIMAFEVKRKAVKMDGGV